ncbi:MAG: ATP-binding protein, partial [Solirubrobacteraceae bacterium]
PDDRERVADAYAQALAGEGAFELECRIVADDGAVQHTVHALGHADPARPGGYLGTVQDVTRQRRAERERLELLEASARAESANRAKSEFLARMSHELRTPLNAIIGFSQLLQLEGLEPRLSEDIGHILTAGNHLLALVNEVLDLARIESGQITISPEPVALANTVHDALALLAPIARERHVSLGIDTDGLADDGHVHADRNRFKQVLLNVLSNAIKYNRPGGRVDISFQITEARVRTMIADTGIGIAPEHLDKLFEPFERLGAERTDVDGTGLGLALSKGLIEAMGGTIEVQSTVGVGTTFVIDLAAAQRPTAERQPSLGDQALGELGGPDARPQLILYIEDNLSNLTLVERILERRVSVELISAMQGTLGLELARQHRPDLVILDLHLPDMPGSEVLTRLKADPSTREIPVIVLTADASGRQAERVRQLGAIDYLTKPLDVSKFIEIIANNLADDQA